MGRFKLKPIMSLQETEIELIRSAMENAGGHPTNVDLMLQNGLHPINKQMYHLIAALGFGFSDALRWCKDHKSEVEAFAGGKIDRWGNALDVTKDPLAQSRSNQKDDDLHVVAPNKKRSTEMG